MNSGYYREKAERCRLMLAVAVVPEVKEQLRLWADEFDQLAEAGERQKRRSDRVGRWRRRLGEVLGSRGMIREPR